MTANQENALAFNSATGTIPAMKSIVANPDQLLAKAPWVKPTLALLPHGQYIGDLTDRDQLFYEIITPSLTNALEGNISVDEAVTKIQQEANAMVDAKK
jgi:ABC-type glycerol-3-phosphate transport system substrate-binding protein